MSYLFRKIKTLVSWKKITNDSFDTNFWIFLFLQGQSYTCNQYKLIHFWKNGLHSGFYSTNWLCWQLITNKLNFLLNMYPEKGGTAILNPKAASK